MRATRYGRDKEYYARAAQETCLLAQIETRGGMANLDAICRVEGLDMVFFGRTDLSADMGHMGQPNHPKIVEAIEQGIRRAVALGMPAGAMAGSPECERYVAAGATVVIVGSDLSLLVRTADALAARHVQAPRRAAWAPARRCGWTTRCSPLIAATGGRRRASAAPAACMRRCGAWA